MSSQSTLLALKATNQSKLIKEKGIQDRHRDCIVLILAYLRSFGYISTATQLQNEGGSTILSRFEVADNMDLTCILQDYEDFFGMRFGRKPKFTRKVSVPGEDDEKRLDKRKHSSASRRRLSQTMSCTNSNNGEQSIEGGIRGNVIRYQQETEEKDKSDSSSVKKHDKYFTEEKVLNPIPDFGGDAEYKAFAVSLQKDILQTSPKVKWDDIIELKDTKEILKEAVVLPLKYPQLFTGILSPWRGVLLYGPPGNGKTLLAKAVATESETTFFNISASSIVSKFRGDSEKLVRVLFEVARFNAPSTIFFDEIDAIMGHRGGNAPSSSSIVGGDGNGEHEGSRRMKTEMLVQMDGISNQSHSVFVLAATNLPWDLDVALLRRLEKRVFVPLPSKQARKQMIEKHLSSFNLEKGINLNVCIESTENYSGSDIKILCKEIAMRPIRRILKQLNKLEVEKDQTAKKTEVSSSIALSPREITQLMKRNFITNDDVTCGLECSSRSADTRLLARYKEWAKEYGSV